MAKNKKKKAQMFRDFLAFKAGQGNTTNIQSQPSLFQTPHGDQEKLTELLDDVVGGGPNQPTEMYKASGSGNNATANPARSKWTALRPVEDSSNLKVNMRQDPKRPNQIIVEGSASKIQLVIDKSKKATAQPSSSPKPEEEFASSIPMESSPTNASQQASEQLTQKQLTQASLPTQPSSVSRYAYNTPQKISGLPPFNYPAGIPKSTVRVEAKNRQAQTGKAIPIITREEKSPSPQANPQGEKKSAPNWVLASHAKPVWQTQQQVHNQGLGWPKARVSAKSQFEGYFPTGPPSGNDLSVQVDVSAMPPQAYSPSDVYSEVVHNEERATDDETELSEMVQAGSKRLSAFQRLGPVAEQPKKPKLTINLLCQKDVRNVVDETDDIPTHLRDYITTSTDEVVVKYLDAWPFKKNIVPARTATARLSKSVMMLETEYMEEAYSRDNRFIVVAVTGYPQHWRKEDVLDAVLESVTGMSFIPCFIEFSRIQCRFLVIRCRAALLAIHKYGFIVRKDDTELIVSLSNVHINLNQLDFVLLTILFLCIEFSRVQCRFLVIRCRAALLAIHKYGFIVRKDDTELIVSLSNVHINLNLLDFVPRLILRKLLSNRLNGDALDLSYFTTKNDISHFVYFPLHRVTNQTELIQLQSNVPWEVLTSLDLSHNKITTLTGLDLVQTTPKLRHLNLSHNYIEKATLLLQCRNLPLTSINLEGNPLCNDYIEQEHYIKVLTMMFTGLVTIDGVQIKQLHDLPDAKRNYCPKGAEHIVEKVLEVMFPLLDASQDQRFLMQELYHEEAVLTITFMYRLRYSAVYKDYRNLFNRARVMDEGDMESIVGPVAIAKVAGRWPDMIHDPATFDVDVLYHSDTTTIVRIGGIVKITAESLADDEHLLSFTRTLALLTKDGSEYKITNELLYWDQPQKEYAETAFKITRVKSKNLNLRLDAPPDEDLKAKLLNVFMQITELPKQPSERCLEEKEWNIRNALEYFTKLLRLDNLHPIMRDS